MKIKPVPKSVFLKSVFLLCVCVCFCVSCSQKMYVASVMVTPAPGTVLKDSTTITIRDNALLTGLVTTNNGELPVIGAGVFLTDLNTEKQPEKGGSATYSDGSFTVLRAAGVYAISVAHMDYNRFGPYMIVLEPGDRREIHIDLSTDPTYGKVDTLRSSKRLTLAEIRSTIIQKDIRLQTIPSDSIMVKIIK